MSEKDTKFKNREYKNRCRGFEDPAAVFLLLLFKNTFYFLERSSVYSLS